MAQQSYIGLQSKEKKKTDNPYLNTFSPTQLGAYSVQSNAAKANSVFGSLISPAKPAQSPAQVQNIQQTKTPSVLGTLAKSNSVTQTPQVQALDVQQASIQAMQPTSIRPITQAPTMLTEKQTTPMTDDEIKASILRKSLKQQYGDSLTDQELDFIVKQQTQQAQDTSVEDLRKAQEAQLKTLTDLRAGEEARLAAERERMKEENARVLEQFKASQEAQAQEAIAEAQRTGKVRTAQEERLLGTRGNLTSTVGAERLGDIERQTSGTITAINARKNSEIALERARLEGASEEQLQAMSSQVQTLRATEAQAIMDAEVALQQAKAQAKQLGEESQMKLIQSALDNLSAEKVKSKANAQLTKDIGDGYVYDEFGQRITDAEGNLITYESPSELQDLVKLGEGDTLFDPNTGEILANVPKTPKAGEEDTPGQSPFMKERALRTVQSVDELKQKAIENPGIFGKSAAVPIPDALRSEAFRNFEAELETLKANIAFSELTAMREASKTGGALGQVSDKENKLLESSLGALSMKQSPENFVAQLDKIKGSIQRWQNALEQQGGQTNNFESDPTYQYLIQNGVSPEEAKEYLGFKNEAQTSVKGIKDNSKVSTSIGNGVATRIVNGSEKWKWGMDLYLDGGIGAPVKAPVSGTVVKSGAEGGFGNRVGIKDSTGKIWYLSHLQAMNVKEGQKVQAGMPIGTQGNTGTVISASGKALSQAQKAKGAGTHVDITVKKPSGGYYTSQQVASFLNTKLA